MDERAELERLRELERLEELERKSSGDSPVSTPKAAAPVPALDPNYQGPAVQKMSEVERLDRAVGQGMTWGWQDELRGVGAAAKSFLDPREAPLDWDKAKEEYRRVQQAEQARDTAALNEGGGTEDTIKTVAGVISPLNRVLAPLKGANTFKNTLVTGLKGAASGAALGIGESKKTGLDAVEDAVLPAIVGGGVGAAGGLIAGRANKGRELMSKGRQEAQAMMDKAIASAQGAAGTPKAAAVRAFEFLKEQLDNPNLDPELRKRVQIYLNSDEGKNLLNEMAEQKLKDAPEELAKFRKLKDKFLELQASAPEKIDELLKSVGMADFLKQRVGGVVDELPLVGKEGAIRKIARAVGEESMSPAQKYAKGKFMRNVNTPLKAAVKSPAGAAARYMSTEDAADKNRTFLEWLRSKDGER